MDTEELIRFRVETELFVDVGPARPVKDALDSLPEAGKQPPYKILGSIAEQGLGLSIWWDQAE